MKKSSDEMFAVGFVALISFIIEILKWIGIGFCIKIGWNLI